MNRYPVWWDSTLTLYNKYMDAQTQKVSWYRTVLNNCFWKATGSKAIVNDVTLDTEGVICRIPKDERFLEKYEWVELPNDRMEDHFTLATDDIIVKGVVTDIINEYQKGHRSTDLLEKYKDLRGCIEIQEVVINTGIARNEEHYLIRGK